jgi:5-aminolevulinate synthase
VNYKNFFKSKVQSFKNEGYYRKFLPVKRSRSTFPYTQVEVAGSKKNAPNKIDNIKIWCTNDYLNMSHNEEVIETMISTINEVGTGSGGTRNISGTSGYHVGLERKLAEFHQRESALIFNSAYLANQSTLWTICKKINGIQVFSDELNHASLIQGIKNSGATCKIFKHNDLNDLESLLKSAEPNSPKLIVFESLYSMDGTITNVAEYVRLAKKYNALTYLDEVHAVGLYGERGSGIANKYGVSKEIDIINGTLAKAFGQIGGYVAGDKYIIEFIRSFTPGFIFTTSLMPSVVAACRKSIEIVEKSNDLRSEVLSKAVYLKNRLDAFGIDFIKGDSHIVPIVVNTAERAQAFSKKLLDAHNIYTQPIFYPTVPKGSARLRITITPKHSISDIDHLVDSLSKVLGNKKTKIMNKKKSNSKFFSQNQFV